MASTPETVLADLKSGKIAPIYFIQGEEPYYIDTILQYVENNVLPASERAFNQVVLYGKDTTVAGILDHARSFSMFSDRKVVIVKEAQELKDFKDLEKEKPAKGKAGANPNIFEAYLKNPQPGTILVIGYKGKPLDARKSLSTNIDKYAVMVTTKKLYDNQVPAWVEGFVKDRGYAIDAKATNMLCENVGTEISRLTNELDKLFINLPAGTTVTAEHISKYVGISKDYNIFELQKALVKKDPEKCMRIANYFGKDPKNNPLVVIIGGLYAYFSKILLIHYNKQLDDNSLATVIKVHPFILKEYKAAAAVYPAGKVLQVIQYIFEADLNSKGVNAGNLSETDILKVLLFKIIH